MSELVFLSALGEDSHSFCELKPETGGSLQAGAEAKPLILGGLTIPGYPGLVGNSDADVILHALTNALSGLTGKAVLGERADQICQAGDTRSTSYLQLALQDLAADPRAFKLLHVSFSLEGKRPHFAPLRDKLRANIARLLGLKPDQVMLTATTGEDLTSFGRGEGLKCTCLISASCQLEMGH